MIKIIKSKKNSDSSALDVKEPPWKILIVDDEPDVHTISRITLDPIVFKNRPVQLLDAYSAQEAKVILSSEKDIALILLDVVMEDDDAGLKLVKYIREVLVNNSVRIILRTGQPGMAPERQVIIDYDINDYKTKNELTSSNLFNTVITSLRSYQDIISLELSQKGLEHIIQMSNYLLKLNSLSDFSSGIINEIASFIGCQPDGIIYQFESLNESNINVSYHAAEVKACSGKFSKCFRCFVVLSSKLIS